MYIKTYDQQNSIQSLKSLQPESDCQTYFAEGTGDKVCIHVDMGVRTNISVNGISKQEKKEGRL